MASFAKYRGQKFKVVKEDGRFVTVEGYGYSKRLLKDEVIMEDPKEEELPATIEDKHELLSSDAGEIPDLPSSRPEGNDLITPKDESVTAAAGAVSNANPAAAAASKETTVPAVSNTENGVVKDSMGDARLNPNYPKFGLDVAVDTTAQRHAENEKRRKESINNMRVRLKEMLDELDSMTHSGTPLDESRPGENHIDTVRITKPGTPTPPPAAPLKEDGAAPASAGGGAPDASGSVNVASTTGPGTSTANVANFSARLGVGETTKQREKDKFENLK